MRKLRAKENATKDKILDSAILIFGENGYHNSKIEQIVSAAGLAKGTVYQYFPSKEALLTAALQRLEAAVASNLKELEGLDLASVRVAAAFRQRLATIFAKLHVWSSGIRHLLQTCRRLGLESPDFHRRLQKVFSEYLRFFDVFFQNGKNQGFVLTRVASNTLSHFVLTLLFEMVERSHSTASSMDPLLEFVSDGLRVAQNVQNAQNLDAHK